MNDRTFIGILDDNGIKFDRQEGSHRQYEGVHAGRRWIVTVAYHQLSDEIKPKTLNSMIRQSGLPKHLFR